MPSPLAEAWRSAHAITMMLLDGMPDTALENRLSPRTRTVASQFAHIHNVRVMHLVKRGNKDLGAIDTFPRGAEPTRAQLERALAASHGELLVMLEQFEAAGKVKSWKGPPESFYGYLVAHEAHHRGLIMASLRISGTKLGKDVSYGLWGAWNKAPG